MRNIVQRIIVSSLAAVWVFSFAGTGFANCTASLPSCVDNEITGLHKDGYAVKSRCALPVLISVTYKEGRVTGKSKSEEKFHLYRNQSRTRTPTPVVGRGWADIQPGSDLWQVKKVLCCEERSISYCSNDINGPVGSQTPYYKKWCVGRSRTDPTCMALGGNTMR